MPHPAETAAEHSSDQAPIIHVEDLVKRYKKATVNAVDGVSPGICHQVAREQIIEPGDFIQATDSHTCMGGASNALAWGVGATEYAALIYWGFTPLSVPEAIRFDLVGELGAGVTAKDVMLHILHTYAKREDTLNRVMEFGGEGLFERGRNAAGADSLHVRMTPNRQQSRRRATHPSARQCNVGQRQDVVYTMGVVGEAHGPHQNSIARCDHHIDGRVDIYGLGCVAYWLLTGEIVFDAKSPMDAVIKHARDIPVPPSKRSEFEIPPALEEIVLASTQPLPWEGDELASSQYAEDIKDMPLGTWVEFIDAKTEKRRRGKLAWKCDFTGEYTFVDRKYKVGRR